MRAPLTVLPCLLLSACAAQVGGGPHLVAGGVPVGDLTLPVSSMAERRFAGVVRQQYDFSCGSAALATLLRFHYGYAVAEEDAFRGMWAKGDREQIRKVGFSLLDMKRWLASRGLAADGYQVGLEQIAEAGIPGIALIAVENYRHFVVIKGIRGDNILIGDPSTGIGSMPRGEFAKVWNGIFFVLTDERDRAQRTFGSDREWSVLARAPVGTNLSEPVSQQSLMLTAPFYGDIS